jgi:hypothetical protein
MLSLFKILSRWPLPVLHALGAALGWGVWWFSPAYRRHFRANVAQAGLPFEAARPAIADAGRFVAEFFPPDLSPVFVNKVAWAAWETLAMSARGTVMAAALGLAQAVPASRMSAQDPAWLRSPTRWLLNALRAIPELVWAALLLISAGLGPMAGTLALALHTSGVLGRLFAEAMENIPTGPGDALRTQGVGQAIGLGLQLRIAVALGAAILLVAADRDAPGPIRRLRPTRRAHGGHIEALGHFPAELAVKLLISRWRAGGSAGNVPFRTSGRGGHGKSPYDV